MPRNYGTKLRAGLNIYLLLLSLACLLPVVAISVYAAWRTGAAYKTTSTSRLDDTSLTLASAIEADIEGRFTILNTFSSLWPKSAGKGPIALRDSPFKGIGLDGQVELFTLADSKSGAGKDSEAAALARQAILKAMPEISNLISAKEKQEYRIYLALPKKGAGNEPCAIVLSISPEELIRTLQQRKDTLSGLLVAVVDGNGRIIGRSRDQAHSIGMEAPDWEKLQALNENSGWFEAMTTEGFHVALSFHKLRNTPGWAVVVGEPLDVFNARWKTPIFGMLFGGALALALATTAAIYISRLILRPIEALAKHSQAIAENSSTADLSALQASPILQFETLRQTVLAAESVRVEQERRARTVARAGAIVLWRWKEDGDLVSAEGWEKLTGLPDHTALGMEWLKQVHPDDRQRVVDVFLMQKEKMAPVDIEFRLLTASGYWLWVRDRGGPVLDDNGDPIEWVGVLEDIHARKDNEERIAHMATHDTLTDLGNRALLRSSLEAAIAQSDRGDVAVLLMLDLDRFKHVNDTLGHPVGDTLLQKVADRLRSCTRKADLVARLGGDEFAIILQGARVGEAAIALAQRLVEAISTPYEIDGHRIEVSASIGLTFIRSPTFSADDYMRRADDALYSSKKDGRGCATLCESESFLKEANELLERYRSVRLRLDTTA